jgi:hypothetical protein
VEEESQKEAVLIALHKAFCLLGPLDKHGRLVRAIVDHQDSDEFLDDVYKTAVEFSSPGEEMPGFLPRYTLLDHGHIAELYLLRLVLISLLD